MSPFLYLWAWMNMGLLAVYDGADRLKIRLEYAGGRLPVAMEQVQGTAQGRYYLAYGQVGALRAGLVKRAEDYPWSGAAGHCGLREDVLAPDAGLLAEAVGDWRAFLAEGELEEETNRLRMHTRTGRPLGGEMFRNLLETLLNRTVRPKRCGQPRKQPQVKK